MTVEEAAESLGLSPATVKRDWSRARAWLFRDLQRVVKERDSVGSRGPVGQPDEPPLRVNTHRTNDCE